MSSVKRTCKKCGAILAQDNLDSLCSPCIGAIDISDELLLLIQNSSDEDIKDIADVLRPMFISN